MNILIVEDEFHIRNLLKINLEEQNYLVYTASNGIEALEILKYNTVDLAILDIIMPELDGLNLLREIRKTNNIPVIFLSAKGQEMDKVLGLGLGADDYIVKPFNSKELLARVEAQLRRRNIYDLVKENHRELVEYKNIKLDLQECILYKDNIEIDLKAKEYLLLKLFMTNPNKIFTKKQLYSRIWEDEYLYDDNTIMVNISRLRNKVEEDSKYPKFIITVRGLGYKFYMKD